MVCAFTGHRPNRLPWGDREEDIHCLALKELLRRQLEQVIEQGCSRFLCGMAMGCDTYFAELVLELKKTHPGITLEAVIPCTGQEEQWPEKDRKRYRILLQQCDRVQILEAAYSDGCMLRRNRTMVDQAQVLISVWDGARSGTGSTVRYAQKRGVTVLPLWI